MVEAAAIICSNPNFECSTARISSGVVHLQAEVATKTLSSRLIRVAEELLGLEEWPAEPSAQVSLVVDKVQIIISPQEVLAVTVPSVGTKALAEATLTATTILAEDRISLP